MGCNLFYHSGHQRGPSDWFSSTIIGRPPLQTSANTGGSQRFTSCPHRRRRWHAWAGKWQYRWRGGARLAGRKSNGQQRWRRGGWSDKQGLPFCPEVSWCAVADRALTGALTETDHSRSPVGPRIQWIDELHVACFAASEVGRTTGAAAAVCAVDYVGSSSRLFIDLVICVIIRPFHWLIVRLIVCSIDRSVDWLIWLIDWFNPLLLALFPSSGFDSHDNVFSTLQAAWMHSTLILRARWLRAVPTTRTSVCGTGTRRRSDTPSTPDI